MVWAAPRRGAVREEPPRQDLPVRPPHRGPFQAGYYGDTFGKQPDGPVGAVLDYCPRALPRSGSLLGVLPATNRAQQGRDAIASAASVDPPADAAPHQGERRIPA